jgi:hypothetical protein
MQTQELLKADSEMFHKVYLDGKVIDLIPKEMYANPQDLQRRIDEAYEYAAFRGQTAAQQMLAGQVKSGYQAMIDAGYQQQALAPMVCTSPPWICLQKHSHPNTQHKAPKPFVDPREPTPTQRFMNEYARAALGTASTTYPRDVFPKEPLVQELKAGPCDICDWPTDDLRGYYMPESDTLWVCVRCKNHLTIEPAPLKKSNILIRFFEWESAPMVTIGAIAIINFASFILTR